ncbi:MAG: hypothetical protein WCP30_04935, partial [Mycobacteriaceae bacterium]
TKAWATAVVALDTDFDVAGVGAVGPMSVVTATEDTTGVEDNPAVAAVEETIGVEDTPVELTGVGVAVGLAATDGPDFTRVAAEAWGAAAADTVGGVAAAPLVEVGDPLECRDDPRVVESDAVGPWLPADPPGGAA